MKIEGLEAIGDIFSIFHDGSISAYALNADELNLEIEIQYLAQRVNAEFRKFDVRLIGVNGVQFSTWPSDLKSNPVVLSNVCDIFAGALEILEGNLREDRIEVVCNQHSSTLAYCGGELSFHCGCAEVTDEVARLIRSKNSRRYARATGMIGHSKIGRNKRIKSTRVACATHTVRCTLSAVHSRR